MYGKEIQGRELRGREQIVSDGIGTEAIYIH